MARAVRILGDGGQEWRHLAKKRPPRGEVITAGDGTEHPKAATKCSVHYEGQLLTDFMDGAKKTFDSSYSRGSPTQFAPNQARAGASM